VVDDLLVTRNPEPGSSLPYLIRIPLGPGGIVVKARETWPGASKVYCHRADGWPADAEVLERHAVRSCSRRGPAIDLASLPRAAVAVEDRYSRLFSFEHAAGATAAESLAEAQARFPSVPIIFCETRPLAQEWAYRWLGACLTELDAAAGTAGVERTFAGGDVVPAAAPRPAEMREWARERGLQVSDRGRIPQDVVRRFLAETGAAG
jgi:hypothetical protein